jgi:hypothetical protein
VQVAPDMQFTGMALEMHDEWNWYDTHAANLPRKDIL